MVYWIVSVPSRETTRDSKLIQEINTRMKQLSCDCAEFKIPKLRVKNMDQLFSVNDDLLKLDSFIEGVAGKLLRTWAELSPNEVEPHIIIDHSLDRDETVPPSVYLNYFQWDEDLPFSKALKEDLEKGCQSIQKFMNQMDDSLKIKQSEFMQIKNQLSTFEKGKTGNLSVRALDDFVEKDHVVYSENLTTLFVVVAKNLYKDWELGYEEITDGVVPNSSEMIHEDKEYGLFNVVILRKCVQDFEAECRKRKFIVRQYEFSPEHVSQKDTTFAELEDKKNRLRRELTQWCRVNYSDCFATWIHVKAVRVYTETVLRFGLHPKYISLIIKVDKNETKVHKYFREMYKSLDLETGDEFEDASGHMGIPNIGSDFTPFVLISLNTSNPLMKL